MSPGDVALKVFRFGGPIEQQAYARTWMLRDWRIWSELTHPHVLPASDYGETNDALFVATPWLGGPSLRAVLDQRRTLEPEQIRELARQLAGALDAAAAIRLVHLDVKPENVVFSSGDGLERAYVRDFGAGRLAAWKVGADQSRTFRGTLEYTAPEVVGGGAVDGRTAVYSLGCLLYETLTGATPYAGRPRAALVRAHLEEPPPRVEGWAAEVDRVFARALAKDCGERYATCTELAEALCAALDVAPARPPAPTARRRQVVRARHAAIAACVAVVATASVAAASWLPVGAHDPARTRDDALSTRDFLAALQAARPVVKAAHKTVRHAPAARPPSTQTARRRQPAQPASNDAPVKVKRPRIAPSPAAGRTAPTLASRPPASSTDPTPSPTVRTGGAGSPSARTTTRAATPPATTTRAAPPASAAPPPPPPPPPANALPPPPPPPP